MSEENPAPSNPVVDVVKGIGIGLANSIAPRTTHNFKSIKKKFDDSNKKRIIAEKKKASELFGREVK